MKRERATAAKIILAALLLVLLRVDRLLFHDKTTGQPLGTAVVTGLETNTAILDKSATNFSNAIVEWHEHACAGWTIQNCHWQDNYQRLLIQSDPGTVRNCTFTRHGSAIELNSVTPYVEGGVPRDITITGNTFICPGEAAISLNSVNGGVIASNRFACPVEQTALAKPMEPRWQQAIWLSRCTNMQVDGNPVSDPGHHTASDLKTGETVLGCERCEGIKLAGRHLS